MTGRWGRRPRCTRRAFLAYATVFLLDLRDGTGWDSEYERDV